MGMTMARRARIDAPGALHHIICRGIERGVIFQVMPTGTILLTGPGFINPA